MPNEKQQYRDLWYAEDAKGLLFYTEKQKNLGVERMGKFDSSDGNAHRVITFLTREEIDFLDKIGKDALFSTGTKLSRSKIISAIVSVVRKFNIDGCGLSSKRQLEGKITKAINNILKINAFTTDTKDEDKQGKGGKDGRAI